MKQTNPNSAIIWRGPSRIDGAPVMVVLTGLANTSKNAKTGNMLQTWIIRADVQPKIARNSGHDESICGQCPLRAGRGGSCYVQIRTPQSVFLAAERGSYREATIAELAPQLRDREVRFGAYGDPAAVPVHVWAELSAACHGHTGYTHQWRTMSAADARHYSRYLMASCDSLADYRDAQSAGWRTFRVRAESDPVLPAEIDCPSNRGVQCADCRMCSGRVSRARKSVSIPVHGPLAVRFAA